MDQDYEGILYRIFSGFYTIDIDGKNYKIISPTISIKNQAHKIYLGVLDDYKFDTTSWISEKAIKNLLKAYNIWDDTKQKLLDESIKDIDKLKIQLYLNFNNSTLKSEIKTKLVSLNDNINKLYAQKHYFDYLTLDHYAQSIKSQFIIVNTILDSNNQPIFNFNDFDYIDIKFLEKIVNHIQDNIIDIYMIKKIARNELWKSFWSISKEKIFDGKIKDWTDDQRSLVNFSKVLDSIREHMEAPSEEIINDDDALDGWILYQHEKTEKEKKKKLINDRYNLDNKKAGELFLVTDNTEEAREIFQLNDPMASTDIKQMQKIANEKGQLNWSELPHVKRDIQQQLMEMNKK